MKANVLGAVARQLVNNFQSDSGTTFQNRILIASFLFQLARLTDELTAETTDLWLKAIGGKVRGFSQIRVTDICREFKNQEAQSFEALWQEDPTSIYLTISRMNGESDDYRKILRMVLIAFCEAVFGNNLADPVWIQIGQSLSNDEWLDQLNFNGDLAQAMNAEFGEFANSHLNGGAANYSKISVEVM
jgi:hypothetical protein